MSGLVDITSLAFDLTEQLKPLDDWLPPSLFQKAVSGTLKQAVERLDNVRLAAVNQLIRLIKLRTPDLLDGNRWSITGRTVLQKELIDEVDEMKTWADGAWLFPKLVQLLEEPVYMVDMLQGFILSIGSRGEGVAQPASVSLVRYANDVPVPEAGNLVQAILKTGQTNFTSNNIFIPVLQTLAEMTEGGVTRKLAASGSVVLVENILSLASRNADKIKSVPRLNDSAKIVIGLLAIPSVADKAVDKLPVYLKHGYPKVRSTTAENLYLALQGMDIEFEDEVEDALLQTTWTDDLAELQAPVDQITAGLRSGLSKASIE
ncbi:hypothetical protein FRB90_000027 [Tulasnella sp. 427]|nr:hypothetical protein FRB90_000027 [Tulasnella sp. 427]